MKVFGKVQKKKKKRKLNHSSRTCVQVLQQRWPTPRVHISTTSLITRFCWQCHVLPAPCQRPRLKLACVRVLLPVLWRSESQLHAWKRLQDPGTFFPNLLSALRWKRPLVVCWTLRSHDELAPPKTLEKKEGVPRWNQCWRLWARQIGASSAWFYSLAWSVFTGTLPILRGSDRDPARQTETCECEPCVMSRPPFVKRCGSFDQTSCLWSSRSLSLSSSFSSSSFFSFLHFLETGKVKTPPPPNGHARILVNAEIYERSLMVACVYEFIIII